MQDNELLASFEPKLVGYVMVLAFDDLEEMLLEQERIQANHRQVRDDEGNLLPQVDTLWMGQSQYGERSMMAGQIRLGALIASEAGITEIQQARKAWAQSRMQQNSMLPAEQGMSEAWHPSTEQMDMLAQYTQHVVEPNPAGRANWTKRIKVSVARAGFNEFAQDQGRPDLQFTGSNGGKAFSAALQSLFPDEVAVLRSAGGHPYVHGLRRREDANPRYFRQA
jgi:hypothetical protein